jgi:hypothetical protein
VKMWSKPDTTTLIIKKPLNGGMKPRCEVGLNCKKKHEQDLRLFVTYFRNGNLQRERGKQYKKNIKIDISEIQYIQYNLLSDLVLCKSILLERSWMKTGHLH